MSSRASHGRAAWGDVWRVDDATTAFFVVIKSTAHRFCFGTVDAVLMLNQNDAPVQFQGAILNNPSITERANVFERSVSDKSFSIEVPLDVFPVVELRQAGEVFQTMQADVFWGIVDVGMDLDDMLHVLTGRVESVVADVKVGKVQIKIREQIVRSGKPFPPIVATQERIANLSDEDSGKCYPVVFGSVKKMPLLNIDGSAPYTSFLVMHDPFGSFTGNSPPNQVTALYEGDSDTAISLAAATDANDTDALDGSYWKVTSTGNTYSDDITADVDGHTPSTLYDVLRMLVTYYGDETIYDTASLRDVRNWLGAYTLRCIFNSRSGAGSVEQIIRNRFMQQFPIMLISDGEKYIFKVVRWEKQTPCVMLLKNKDIIETTQPPVETSSDDLVNHLVLQYGMSGRRGSMVDVIVRDPDSSLDCQRSADRYGNRMGREFTAPDLDTGAEQLMEWLIQTYSRIRVTVKYRCKLEKAATLQLLDVVQVRDEDEGWVQHEPQFLVTGITRSTGPHVDIELLSLEDISDVYSVNREWTEQHNFVPIPHNWDDSHWSKTRCTVTYDQDDPDGGDNALIISEDGTAAASHYVYYRSSYWTPWFQGRRYRASCYAKADNRTWFELFVQDSNSDGSDWNWIDCYFDLDNGVIGTPTGCDHATIEDVGSGWYKCSIFFTAEFTHWRFVPTIGEADGDRYFDGLSQSSIYIYKPELVLLG